MKQVVLILFFALTIACSDDSGTDQGCLTGIPKSGPQDRVLIKCSTRQEYLAGSNTSAGGTSSWTLYNGHQWEKCGDCK
jgi:hypothetical protein